MCRDQVVVVVDKKETNTSNAAADRVRVIEKEPIGRAGVGVEVVCG